MKAMILSAGLGTRMRPLTDTLPKPLLPVGGSTLIEHHLGVLKALGIREVVINTGYLGHMIRDCLQDGSRYGMRILYTEENPARLLGSGGGVKQALPHLGDQPFLLLSADVWTDFSLGDLIANPSRGVVDLLVVDNPDYHAQGDFSVAADGRVQMSRVDSRVTFSGIGVFCPSYFTAIKAQEFGLGQVIQQAIRADACFASKISDAIYVNVGTPSRLMALNALLCDEVCVTS